MVAAGPGQRERLRDPARPQRPDLSCQLTWPTAAPLPVNSLPIAPPIAPVTAELSVPSASNETGTSPIRYDRKMPISAHTPPAIAPPAAREPTLPPRASAAYAMPASSEIHMPPTAKRPAIELLKWPDTTMAI